MKAILLAALCCTAGFGQTIAIVNSGSTNTAGFRIEVKPSGEAEYTSQPRRIGFLRGEEPRNVQKTIPKGLADRLYRDVKAARPLSALPPQHCVKSVSFGTRLTIEEGDDSSPDLSCGDGGNEKLKALIADANEIVRIFRSQ